MTRVRVRVRVRVKTVVMSSTAWYQRRVDNIVLTIHYNNNKKVRDAMHRMVL